MAELGNKHLSSNLPELAGGKAGVRTFDGASPPYGALNVATSIKTVEFFAYKNPGMTGTRYLFDLGLFFGTIPAPTMVINSTQITNTLLQVVVLHDTGQQQSVFAPALNTEDEWYHIVVMGNDGGDPSLPHPQGASKWIVASAPLGLRPDGTPISGANLNPTFPGNYQVSHFTHTAASQGFATIAPPGFSARGGILSRYIDAPLSERWLGGICEVRLWQERRSFADINASRSQFVTYNETTEPFLRHCFRFNESSPTSPTSYDDVGVQDSRFTQEDGTGTTGGGGFTGHPFATAVISTVDIGLTADGTATSDIGVRLPIGIGLVADGVAVSSVGIQSFSDIFVESNGESAANILATVILAKSSDMLSIGSGTAVLNVQVQLSSFLVAGLGTSTSLLKVGAIASTADMDVTLSGTAVASIGMTALGLFDVSATGSSTVAIGLQTIEDLSLQASGVAVATVTVVVNRVPFSLTSDGAAITTISATGVAVQVDLGLTSGGASTGTIPVATLEDVSVNSTGTSSVNVSINAISDLSLFSNGAGTVEIKVTVLTKAVPLVAAGSGTMTVVVDAVATVADFPFTASGTSTASIGMTSIGSFAVSSTGAATVAISVQAINDISLQTTGLATVSIGVVVQTVDVGLLAAGSATVDFGVRVFVVDFDLTASGSSNVAVGTNKQENLPFLSSGAGTMTLLVFGQPSSHDIGLVSSGFTISTIRVKVNLIDLDLEAAGGSAVNVGAVGSFVPSGLRANGNSGVAIGLEATNLPVPLSLLSTGASVSSVPVETTKSFFLTATGSSAVVMGTQAVQDLLLSSSGTAEVMIGLARLNVNLPLTANGTSAMDSGAFVNLTNVLLLASGGASVSVGAQVRVNLALISDGSAVVDVGFVNLHNFDQTSAGVAVSTISVESLTVSVGFFVVSDGVAISRIGVKTLKDSALTAVGSSTSHISVLSISDLSLQSSGVATAALSVSRLFVSVGIKADGTSGTTVETKVNLKATLLASDGGASASIGVESNATVVDTGLVASGTSAFDSGLRSFVSVPLVSSGTSAFNVFSGTFGSVSLISNGEATFSITLQNTINLSLSFIGTADVNIGFVNLHRFPVQCFGTSAAAIGLNTLGNLSVSSTGTSNVAIGLNVIVNLRLEAQGFGQVDSQPTALGQVNIAGFGISTVSISVEKFTPTAMSFVAHGQSSVAMDFANVVGLGVSSTGAAGASISVATTRSFGLQASGVSGCNVSIQLPGFVNIAIAAAGAGSAAVAVIVRVSIAFSAGGAGSAAISIGNSGAISLLAAGQSISRLTVVRPGAVAFSSSGGSFSRLRVRLKGACCVTEQSDIWNVALVMLGYECVQTDQDNTEQAELMRKVYPEFLECFLMETRWNGATKTVPLSPAEGAVVPSRWRSAYELPCDFLRALAVNSHYDGPQGGVSWEIETNDAINRRVLYTNEATVELEYIFKVDDLCLLSAKTREALAYGLAFKTARALGKGTSETARLKAEYDQILNDAKAVDGQQQTMKRRPPSRALRARSRGPYSSLYDPDLGRVL